MIGGVRCKIHFFCMDLPQSDAPPSRDDGSVPGWPCVGLREGSEAATVAVAASLASPTGPGRETTEHTDVLMDVAIAIKSAELCRFAFDPVAAVKYMEEQDLPRGLFELHSKTYLLLADGILRSSGDLTFCERKVLPSSDLMVCGLCQSYRGQPRCGDA